MLQQRFVRCSFCASLLKAWKVIITVKGLQCPYCKGYMIEEVEL